MIIDITGSTSKMMETFINRFFFQKNRLKISIETIGYFSWSLQKLYWNQQISVVILLFVTCLVLMYEYGIFGSVFESKIAFESNNLSPYVCFQLLTNCSVLVLQLTSVPGIVAEKDFSLNQ